jgi:hypothetical protein
VDGHTNFRDLGLLSVAGELSVGRAIGREELTSLIFHRWYVPTSGSWMEGAPRSSVGGGDDVADSVDLSRIVHHGDAMPHDGVGV